MISIKELITELLKLFNNIINIFSDAFKINISNKIVYIQEENKSIECANFLKNIKKQENDVIPYEIKKEFKVIKKDLICQSNIFGKSAKDNVCNFEFNVVSSNWNTFNEKKYICYDLNSNNSDAIYPTLVSYDGFAKCLRFPLNKAANKNDDIKVQLNYTHKGCMSDKRCYIISDLNYKKINLNNYTVAIRIKDFMTKNIRIYLLNKKEFTYKFVEKIFPVDSKSNFYENEYVTFVHNANVNDIRGYMSIIYFFDK